MNFEDPVHFTNTEPFRRAYEASVTDAAANVWANQMIRMQISYTVALIVRALRHSDHVLDRDLDSNVPKYWRERAAELAIQLGYARRSEWHGKPSLRSVPAVATT